MNGIDVSRWQGNIDWKRAARETEFAMIRLGWGNGRGVSKDAFFDRNVHCALCEDLSVGVYVYSYAKTVDEAKREAEGTLELLRGHRGELRFPVAFDMEEHRLGAELMTSICETFLERIEAEGWFAQIYSSTAFFRDDLIDARLKRFDHWVAQYYSRCTYPGEYGMWQYSSKGRLSGVDGYVDLNVAYRDYPSIIVSGGFNGFAPSLAGDGDGDGHLTARDARLVLRAAIGLETLPPGRLRAADIDGDGEVTAHDARAVMRSCI